MEEESQKREAKRSIREEEFDVENRKRLDKHKEKWKEGRIRRGDVKALENDIKTMKKTLEIREQEYLVIVYRSKSLEGAFPNEIKRVKDEVQKKQKEMKEIE